MVLGKTIKAGLVFLFLLVVVLAVRPYTEVNLFTGDEGNLTVNVTYSGSPLFGANITLRNGSYGTGFNITYNNGSRWFNLTTDTSGLVNFLNLSRADNYTYVVRTPGYFPAYGPIINISDGTYSYNFTSNITLIPETLDPTYTSFDSLCGTSQNASQDCNFSITINGTYSYIKNITLFANSTSSDAFIAYSTVLYPETNQSNMTVRFGYNIPYSYTNHTLSFRYYIEDQAGNTNYTPYYNISITKNSTPTVWTVTPSAYFVRPSQSITVASFANDSYYTSLRLNVSLINVTTGELVYNTSVSTHTNNIYSAMIPMDFDDGNYSLNITAYDNYNNSFMNKSSWVVVDNTSANVSSVLLSNAVSNRFGMITVDAFVFDNNNVSLDSFTVKLTTNQSATEYDMMYVSENKWEYNWSVPFLGTYDVLINISALDVAGNLAWNDSNVLTVDNSKPTIMFVDPESQSENVTYNATLLPNGTHMSFLNITYSLSELVNTTFIAFNYTRYHVLMASGLSNFSYNASFPGRYFFEAVTNDSAGNYDFDEVTFYVNALLNTTAWLSYLNDSRFAIDNVWLYNYTDSSLLIDVVNISESPVCTLTGCSSAGDLFSIKYNLTDNRSVTFNSVDLFNSSLVSRVRFNLSNSSLSNNITLYKGANVVESLQIINPYQYIENETNRIALVQQPFFYQNISILLNTSTSDFDEAHVCYQITDSDIHCERILDCSISGSGADACYSSYQGRTQLLVQYVAEFVSKDYLSFVLVNDTEDPKISLLPSTNNTNFTSHYGNVVVVSVNEQANCSYSLNATSGNYNVSIGNYTLPIGNRSSSSYSFSVLPSPYYLNGNYEMNITCSDYYLNNNTYIWHFTINDSTAPVITSKTSGSFSSGTTSVTMQLVTDELAECRYGTSSYFNYDSADALSTTDHLTHSTAITTTDGTAYTYYISCNDYNNNSINTTITFSIASPSDSSSADSETSTSSLSSYSSDDAYIKLKTIDSVVENETFEVFYSSSKGVKNIVFTPSVTYDGEFNITLATFTDGDDLPNGVNPISDSQVSLYKYVTLEFEGNFTEENISMQATTFTIRQSFLESLNISIDKFHVLKYDASTDIWREVLPSSVVIGTTYNELVIEDSSLVYSVVYETVSDLGTVGESIANQSSTSNNATVATTKSEESDTSTITSADVKHDDSKIVNSSMDKEQIITLLVMVAGIITLIGIGLMNKEKIKTALSFKSNAKTPSGFSTGNATTVGEQAGTGSFSLKSGDSKVKSPTDVLVDYANKDKNKSELVEKGDTSLHKENIALPATLKPYPLKEMKLTSQDKHVLEDTLRKMFKNVWVSGFNNTTIKTKIATKEWSKDDVYKAYTFIYRDAVDEEISDASYPDLNIMKLVETLRTEIAKVHGFKKSELVDRLSKNGWKSQIINEVLEKLDSEMTLPFSDDLSSVQISSKQSKKVQSSTIVEGITADEDKEIKEYIKRAKSKGASKRLIKEKLLSAGWNPRYVDSVLQREF